MSDPHRVQTERRLRNEWTALPGAKQSRMSLAVAEAAFRRYAAMSAGVALIALLSAPVQASSQGTAPVRRVETLPCGTGAFRLESDLWRGPDTPYAPISQTFTVTSAGRTRALPLTDLGVASSQGRRVRRGFASSWACVAADDRRAFLSVTMTCAVDTGFPGDRGGVKEWTELFDDRGRRLDAGLPRRGGPRYDRLLRRLRLDRAFAEGYQAADVLGDTP